MDPVSPSSSSPRQQTLLAAATRVLAAAGLRGLTHRAVDAEAGLSQGTCSAYFRTRLALLTAVAEHVAGTFAADIAEVTGRLEDGVSRSGVPTAPGPALAETSAMLRRWLDDPDLLLARMELTLEGTRQPDLAAVFARQSEQLVDLVAHAMDTAHPQESCTPPDHRSRAGTLIAAVDGVLLRALRTDGPGRERVLDESLGQLLPALLGEDAGEGV